MKGDTRALGILKFLQNPMAAGFEDYATLVLPLVDAIRIWLSMNEGRFTLPRLIDQGLEALAKNLGGS